MRSKKGTVISTKDGRTVVKIDRFNVVYEQAGFKVGDEVNCISYNEFGQGPNEGTIIDIRAGIAKVELSRCDQIPIEPGDCTYIEAKDFSVGDKIQWKHVSRLEKNTP